MPRHVLVVDDEAPIRVVLRAYLEQGGFVVSETGSGAEALRQMTATDSSRPDLVLLDVGLPDLDGLEVLRRARTQSDVFVILVTARAEEVDKLVGLGVGADDYITKPFSPREVVARVSTVLRRLRDGALPVADEPRVRSAGLDAAQHFDGLSIDEERREVVADGQPVTLTTLEFDLLRALAGSPGRVFSRAQPLEQVWGYDFYGDERVVDVHIRSIRKTLDDDASAPRIIGTVRGVGYKFLLREAGGPR